MHVRIIEEVFLARQQFMWFSALSKDTEFIASPRFDW